MLTNRLFETLVFIKQYMENNVISPSVLDIMHGVGLSSKSQVHLLVKRLKERGFIRHEYGAVRALEIIKMPKGWEMYARRVDDNQKEIIEAFRKLGYSVRDTSRLGEGYPDLTIGKAGINYLIEVKDGKKPPSARKLTPAEQKFKDEWRGQYTVIESVDDVIAFDRRIP